MNKNKKRSDNKKIRIEFACPAGCESDNMGGQCSVKTPVIALNMIAQVLKA